MIRRPHLAYANEIWHPISRYIQDLEKLEKVQKKALKIIMGKIYHVNLDFENQNYLLLYIDEWGVIDTCTLNHG